MESNASGSVRIDHHGARALEPVGRGGMEAGGRSPKVVGGDPVPTSDLDIGVALGFQQLDGRG